MTAGSDIYKNLEGQTVVRLKTGAETSSHHSFSILSSCGTVELLNEIKSTKEKAVSL